MTRISYPTDGNLALAPQLSKENRFNVVDGGLTATPSVTSHHVSEFDLSAAMPARKAAPRSASAVALVLSVSAVLVLAAILCIGYASHAMTLQDARANAPRETVVVDAGDTLWSLAASHPIKGLSTDETVSIIEDWNNVDAGALQPGWELSVPDAVVS